MNAISVKNISKKYELGLIGSGSLRETIANKFNKSKNSKEEGVFWALRDINFDVPVGQTLGIIGHNGAGKSTLLKVISKITEPTTGRIDFTGRVASLLEVGTGFHPELTGRENIYLNGAILGMGKSEIKRKFDEIVDFSGVEKFLETPVKRYSSGMYVRLAFSVAAHLEPEILLVDEVLSVGDYEFQKKCLGKMGDVASGGRTVLFVSHNMGAVQQLTERCLLINNGNIVMDNDPSEAVLSYMKIGSEEDISVSYSIKSRSPEFQILSFGFNQRRGQYGFNKPLFFEMEVDSKKAIKALMTNVTFTNSIGARLITAKCQLVDLKKGNYKVVFQLSDHHLPPGNYSVSLFVGKSGDVFVREEGLLNISLSDRNVEDPLLVPHLDKGRDKIGTFQSLSFNYE